MAFVSSAISIGTAAYGAAKSSQAAWDAYGSASRDVVEIQKQMKLQANTDEFSRESQAKAFIANVESDNWQVQQLAQQQKLLELRGLSDRTIMLENYNDTMEMSMVMGAASGRTLGSGSIDAIFSKSQEDFNFEQMWNLDSEIITNAAIEADKTNIYKAGYNTLLGGADQMYIARQRSQLGQSNTALSVAQQNNQIQQTFNRSITQSIQTLGYSFAEGFKAYEFGPNQPTRRNSLLNPKLGGGKNVRWATTPVVSL